MSAYLNTPAGRKLLIRGKVVEAKNAPEGGPRWVAKLSDGTTVVGLPSFLGNSGPVALPNDEAQPMSDWRRLMARCKENRTRITALGIYVPPYGWFHAPENRGAYGFLEYHQQVMNGQTFRQACFGLSILWEDEGGKVIGHRVMFRGVLEGLSYPGRQPCMIAID